MGILLKGNDTHRIVFLPETNAIVFEKKKQDSLGADMWVVIRELLAVYSDPRFNVTRKVAIHEFLLELYHNHIPVEEQVIIHDNRLLET